MRDSREEPSVSVEVSDEELGSQPALPERRLLGAVLGRAVLDLSSDDEKLVEETENWFNEPLVENPNPLTFQYICEVLDLDPIQIRAKASRQRENQNLQKVIKITREG